jgi:hypothetical protein
MQWVFDLITATTGATDQTEIEEIYGYMADEIRTFGDASPAKLRREARNGKAVFDYVRTDAGKVQLAALELEYAACLA